MGTNYYLIQGKEKKCEHCGSILSAPEELHIGKSSLGWAFALHAYPERNIVSLEDWTKLFNAPNTEIRNEYGRTVPPEEMLECITDRRKHSERRLERHRSHEYGGRVDVAEGVDYDILYFDFG